MLLLLWSLTEEKQALRCPVSQASGSSIHGCHTKPLLGEELEAKRHYTESQLVLPVTAMNATTRGLC